jgi:hypothetical protein
MYAAVARAEPQSEWVGQSGLMDHAHAAHIGLALWHQRLHQLQFGGGGGGARVRLRATRQSGGVCQSFHRSIPSNAQPQTTDDTSERDTKQTALGVWIMCVCMCVCVCMWVCVRVIVWPQTFGFAGRFFGV